MGYLFLPPSPVLLGASAWAWPAGLEVEGLPVVADDGAAAAAAVATPAPTGFLGVIVMVVPLLPGADEALLMEMRGGDGEREGEEV